MSPATNGRPPTGASPQELEADIERQREQLAATVDRLQTPLRARR